MTQSDRGRLPGDAVELLSGADGATVMLSCEHASNRLPEPWRWPDEDQWLCETHWAYDIGAAAIARALAARLGAPAVLSRFTRLLVDPNRPAADATLIRVFAEGKPIVLNAQLTRDERERRLAYWRCYHHTLASVLGSSGAPVLLAIHSFTPNYEGSRRQLDIGVLFDRDEDLGQALALHLAKMGARVERNQPYSGKRGMIYACNRHAIEHKRRAVEIEVRQDLAVDNGFQQMIVDRLAEFAWSESAAG
jgi:predicted N-formylglutamate amidohydrolase